MAEPAEKPEDRLFEALLYLLLRSGTSEALFLVKELVDQHVILPEDGESLIDAVWLRVNRRR